MSVENGLSLDVYFQFEMKISWVVLGSRLTLFTKLIALPTYEKYNLNMFRTWILCTRCNNAENAKQHVYLHCFLVVLHMEIQYNFAK